MSAWERAFQAKKRADFTRSFSGLPSNLGGKPASSIAGPTSANLFRVQSQTSQGQGPGLPVGTFTDGRTVTIPTAPDYVPGAEDRIVTTDPSEIPKPDPYPTVLPSLSAAQLGQLAERRRLIDERLKQAEAESERRRSLVEASATRSRQSAERESQRSIQDFMREAAGSGLARSPMVAGRGVRRSGEDLRLEYGEIDTRLSTEIAALQDLVSQAENERSIGMSQIEQERVNMQADLDRLFPAASMYRS